MVWLWARKTQEPPLGAQRLTVKEEAALASDAALGSETAFITCYKTYLLDELNGGFASSTSTLLYGKLLNNTPFKAGLRGLSQRRWGSCPPPFSRQPVQCV